MQHHTQQHRHRQHSLLYMSQTEMPTAINRFDCIPASRWHQYHAWLSTVDLRYLIFNRKHNSFDRWVKWVGRRVPIDEEAFVQWVEWKSKEEGR